MALMQEITDDPKVRVHYTWDNEVRFETEDPYGFWKISYKHGQLPGELSGRYTSYMEALRAAERYFLGRNNPLADRPYKKPELETKKRVPQSKSD